MWIGKNRHSPQSGGVNEAQMGLVITAFGHERHQLSIDLKKST
jgi:hypothetical protein